MANEEKKPVAPQTKGAAVKRTDKKLGFFKRVAKWFREMKSELKKVVWPTPKQFGKNTLVALVVMAAADRAGDAALFADEHRRARAARRAAAIGDDCYEHSIALFFDFIKQLGKNPSHGYSS